MPPKKSERKSLILEASFEDILVCENKAIRPLLEVFVFEPENIDQKNLGTLFGIFEVADESEDSSYIVNYLLSVIKKEYFSKPKRAPIESFEAALHKGNLALSKIAEHGNVAWIGKLNAIIAIIEKNNLHLTQAGNTAAFLFRANMLTNVSEGLASIEANSNPLKTFVNVSSGRLEKSDKLILTTESIFDIFSLEEIKKSILRFSKENFVQFLKTALVNELQKAAVLVVDLDEKDLPAIVKPEKKDSTANVFSQSAFKKESAGNMPSQEILEELEKEKAEGQKEKDEKNQNRSHIYIKETAEPEHNAWQNRPSGQKNEIIKDTAAAIGEKLGNIQESSARFLKKLADRANKSAGRIAAPQPRLRLDAAKIKFQFPKMTPHFLAAKNKIAAKARSIDWQKHSVALKTKTRSAMVSAGNLKSRVNLPEVSLGRPGFDPKFLRTKNVIAEFFSSIAPSISKIKDLGLRLNYQQRLYVILIILAVIIIPFLATHDFASETPTDQSTQTATEVAENPNQDKNLVRLESLDAAYSETDILRLINLNDKIFAVSQAQITDVQNKDTAPVPADFGKIKLAAGMDDLRLIFILNGENRILSYSPVSKKFQDAAITFPAGANITAIGTYLTYLYAVDATNNQIYRFPRATGGFGEKTNWLKDSTDVSKTKNIAINDSIFIITDSNNLIKLFNYVKKDFTPEDTYHKIIPSIAYAKPGSDNVFVLDAQNSKIAKLDANGQIQAQYFHAEFEKASDFSISEASSIAYVIIGNDVKTFSLTTN